MCSIAVETFASVLWLWNLLLVFYGFRVWDPFKKEKNYLSIYLITWNVVTVEPPPSEQLQSLLDLYTDFIAIALQEVKSQPQNLSR
uniref:Uncharacterized protein n=1 Tax=Daphnia galeata TaxID=27404 RepID=A0A8J2RUR2_9CRUS|nr:unnamed protein product [Daphnia galeata]